MSINAPPHKSTHECEPEWCKIVQCTTTRTRSLRLSLKVTSPRAIASTTCATLGAEAAMCAAHSCVTRVG